MKSMPKVVLMLAAITLLTSAIGFAQTGTLTVNATVNNVCTLNASDMAFGPYDPVGVNAVTDLPAMATVTARCTTGDAYTIGMNDGQQPASGSSTLVPLRQMSDGGANRLAYFVYLDEGRSQIWGSDPLVRASGTGTGSDQALTAYGKLTHGQNMPTGNYLDSVTLTVYY